MCLTIEGVLHGQHACVLLQVEGVVGLTGEAEDQLRVGGLGKKGNNVFSINKHVRYMPYKIMLSFETLFQNTFVA